MQPMICDYCGRDGAIYGVYDNTPSSTKALCHGCYQAHCRKLPPLPSPVPSSIAATKTQEEKTPTMTTLLVGGLSPRGRAMRALLKRYTGSPLHAIDAQALAIGLEELCRNWNLGPESIAGMEEELATQRGQKTARAPFEQLELFVKDEKGNYVPYDGTTITP
jgi:hypothetical protein